MAIHIATYFATKSGCWNFIEISLNFRWNFVVTWFDIRYFQEISTKFQRCFFVAKLCGKTFCHIPKLRNYLGFNEIRFATKFCHQNDRWNFVELSFKYRMSNHVTTKFQRKFNKFSTKVFCGKIVWQNVLPQTSHELPTNFQRISYEGFLILQTKGWPYTGKTCRVTF